MPQLLLGRTAATTAALSLCIGAVAYACPKNTPPTSDPPVCNTASKHSQGGTLEAQDPPVRQPSNRYRHQLHQKPGHGRGLPGAASHSPSLSICGPGTPPPTDNGTPPPTDNGTPPPTDNGTPPPTDNGTTTPPTDPTTTPPASGGGDT